MAERRSSFAPLFVALAILLIPGVYFGAYLALIDPIGSPVLVMAPGPIDSFDHLVLTDHYRWGGSFAAQIFWPLEQLDRRLRPQAWEPLQLSLPPLESCFGAPLVRDVPTTEDED